MSVLAIKAVLIQHIKFDTDSNIIICTSLNEQILPNRHYKTYMYQYLFLLTITIHNHA